MGACCICIKFASAVKQEVLFFTNAACPCNFLNLIWQFATHTRTLDFF